MIGRNVLMLKLGRLYARHKEKVDQIVLIVKDIVMYVQIFAIGYALTKRIMMITPKHFTLVKAALAFSTYLFFTLWVHARLTLGSSFTFLPSAEAGALATEGLYFRFTAPMYLFSTLCFSCWSVLIDEPQYMLLLVLLVPLQIYRAKMESGRLRERYGDEYEAYLENVWI